MREMVDLLIQKSAASALKDTFVFSLARHISNRCSINFMESEGPDISLTKISKNGLVMPVQDLNSSSLLNWSIVKPWLPPFSSVNEQESLKV